MELAPEPKPADNPKPAVELNATEEYDSFAALVLCVAGHKQSRGTEALAAAPPDFRRNKGLNAHTLFAELAKQVKSPETVEEDLKELTRFRLINDLRDGESGLKDLTPLAGLTNLKHFSMDSFRVNIDLAPLAGLVNMEKLSLSSNKIVRVTGVAGMVNLNILNLHNNAIADLTPLKELVNLTVLELGRNKIKDVTALVGMTKLVKLDLGSNSMIMSLQGLEGCVSLTYLDLYSANFKGHVADLTPLAGLTELKTLLLDNNKVVNLTPLAGLGKLEKLSLADNLILDVVPLAGLKSLAMLAVSGNQIATTAPLAELRKGGLQIHEDVPSSACCAIC